MRGIGACAALTAFGGLILGTAPARAAVTLPAGSGFVQCSTTSGLITGTSCNGGTDSGLVTFSPDAGVSGSAFGLGLVDEANVFGVLNYSFEVIGGTPGTVVPVDIETTLQAIPDSIGVVFSEIQVAANTTASFVICNSGGLGCGAGTGETNFSGVLEVDALSDTAYVTTGTSFNQGVTPRGRGGRRPRREFQRRHGERRPSSICRSDLSQCERVQHRSEPQRRQRRAHDPRAGHLGADGRRIRWPCRS